ncbi:MAG TPA: phosphatidate cytidylyltransferase [Terriglobales bacterium]|nr:phosphatidate cytidylyltransferase [Terriglobales bacterium]
MTWKRVATALVLIPVVVGLVLFTPTWVVAIATAVITVLALWEYFALGEAIGHRAYRVWTSFCAVLLILSFSFSLTLPQVVTIANPNLSPKVLQGEILLLFLISLLLLYLFGIASLTLWTRRPLVEALPAAGISSSGLLLVGFPLSFAVALHGIPNDGPKLLLFALVLTWAADTTAYFVGRAVGKHALAPHLSPKKTWEGSIGSMVGSLIVGWAFSYWIKMPLGHLLAMAAIGNVAGQMGDLLESAYKRSAGVKDSGGLLPGHGGVLDRIDALILCIPVVWYYVVLVNPRGM